LDIERQPNSIACEQSESSLATFPGQFRLDFFPAVIFTGVRQINSPPIYFQSSSAHHAPLCNPWCGIAARRRSMKLHRRAVPHADKCAENVKSLHGNSAAMISSIKFFHHAMLISVKD
jgi:hypothetical protein